MAKPLTIDALVSRIEDASERLAAAQKLARSADRVRNRSLPGILSSTRHRPAAILAVRLAARHAG